MEACGSANSGGGAGLHHYLPTGVQLSQWGSKWWKEQGRMEEEWGKCLAEEKAGERRNGGGTHQFSLESSPSSFPCLISSVIRQQNTVADVVLRRSIGLLQAYPKFPYLYDTCGPPPCWCNACPISMSASVRGRISGFSIWYPLIFLLL